MTVDTTAPTVADVSSPTANGAYAAGSSIPVTVQFSEPVTVTGFPQLALNTGGTATYTGGSGTNTLTFGYTVAAGENSADLDYTATNALSLNGGSIADAATNNATLTLAAPGATHSLGANKDLVVDTTAPVVSSVTDTPDPTDTSSTIGYSLSEPATVTIRVYDNTDTLVRTLVNGVAQAAGPQSALWDLNDDSATELASGLYTYKIDASDPAGNNAVQQTGDRVGLAGDPARDHQRAGVGHGRSGVGDDHRRAPDRVEQPDERRRHDRVPLLLLGDG